MKLIEKRRRKKTLKHFTFVGHMLSAVVCGAYAKMPPELQQQIPAMWLAGAIFILNLWAGFGAFVDQGDEQ